MAEEVRNEMIEYLNEFRFGVPRVFGEFKSEMGGPSSAHARN